MVNTYKQGAAFSVFFSVVGKAFSLVSSLLVAFYFGAQSKTDIYFYLILIAALLNGWLAGINASVVIPEFMHLRQKSEKTAISFANFFLYIYAAFSAVVIIWCFVLPQQTLAFLSAFPKEDIQNNLNLIGLASIYFTSFFVMTFLISIAESYKLFKIYFLSPLNTLIALIFLLTTRRLEAMFIGYIAAYLIQIAACLIMLKIQTKWHFGFKKPVLSQKFKDNFTFHQPNNIAWTALLYVPLFMVSATTAGMVSAVNYSRTLSDSLLDIFVSKLNNVAKVKITAEAAAEDFKNMSLTLIRTDKILMFILIPVCVFTSLFSLDIIKMFFMRGSFSPEDASNTAVFLGIFVLTVPLVSLHNNLTNLFSAMRLVKELVPRYLALALIFIAVFIIGIKTKGAFAYPVIFAALYVVTTLVNIFTVRQYAKFIPYAKHLLYILKLFIVSFICALAARELFSFYNGNIFIKIFINGSFFVALNSLLYLVLGDVKQVKEALNIKWKLR